MRDVVKDEGVDRTDWGGLVVRVRGERCVGCGREGEGIGLRGERQGQIEGERGRDEGKEAEELHFGGRRGPDYCMAEADGGGR